MIIEIENFCQVKSNVLKITADLWKVLSNDVIQFKKLLIVQINNFSEIMFVFHFLTEFVNGRKKDRKKSELVSNKYNFFLIVFHTKIKLSEFSFLVAYHPVVQLIFKDWFLISDL